LQISNRVGDKEEKLQTAGLTLDSYFSYLELRMNNTSTAFITRC